MSRVSRQADRSHIRLRATMRMPILSNGAQAEGAFTCYEKQQRVSGSLHQRYGAVELARIDDALVVDYIAGRRHQQLGSLMSRNALELELTVAEVLAYYDLASCAEPQIVDALRRLTGTLITLELWKGCQYPRQFPLIEARRIAPGRFAIKPSAWFDAELMDGEIVSAPRYSSRLGSFRFRLDGWARSWVGRNPRTGDQIITRRDALARVGALPDQMAGTAWEHLLAVVEADNLTGFDLALVEHRGQPAIAVEERQYADRPNMAGADPAGTPDDEDAINFSFDADDDADASVAPREITLELEGPEPVPPDKPAPIQALAPGYFTTVIPSVPPTTPLSLGPASTPIREIFLD